MTTAFKGIAKVILIILIALFILLLCCNLYLVLSKSLLGYEHPTIFGMYAAIVVSGSMEPALMTDDMIIVRRADNYNIGDIITFESDGCLVTHRIVAAENDGFTTRGDANNVDDADIVNADNIVGRVILRIPNAGRLVQFLRSPIGMLLLVFAGLAILMLPSQFSHTAKNHTGENIRDEKH